MCVREKERGREREGVERGGRVCVCVCEREGGERERERGGERGGEGTKGGEIECVCDRERNREKEVERREI